MPLGKVPLTIPLDLGDGPKIYTINGHNEMYQWGWESKRSSGYQKHRHYILKRDNSTCVYCGDKKGPFELDHIMPVSRGGPDHTNNLVCSCRKCNQYKKARTPHEIGWDWPKIKDRVIYL